MRFKVGSKTIELDQVRYLSPEILVAELPDGEIAMFFPGDANDADIEEVEGVLSQLGMSAPGEGGVYMDVHYDRLEEDYVEEEQDTGSEREDSGRASGGSSEGRTVEEGSGGKGRVREHAYIRGSNEEPDESARGARGNRERERTKGGKNTVPGVSLPALTKNKRVRDTFRGAVVAGRLTQTTALGLKRAPKIQIRPKEDRR